MPNLLFDLFLCKFKVSKGIKKIPFVGSFCCLCFFFVFPHSWAPGYFCLFLSGQCNLCVKSGAHLGVGSWGWEGLWIGIHQTSYPNDLRRCCQNHPKRKNQRTLWNPTVRYVFDDQSWAPHEQPWWPFEMCGSVTKTIGFIVWIFYDIWKWKSLTRGRNEEKTRQVKNGCREREKEKRFIPSLELFMG